MVAPEPGGEVGRARRAGPTAPVVSLLVVSLGLALGLGGAFAWWKATRHDGRPQPVPSAQRLDLPGQKTASPTSLPLFQAPTKAPEAAATADGALTAFLEAQSAGKTEVAYSLLTDKARSRFPTLSRWADAQLDQMRPLTFSLVGGEASSTTPADGQDFAVVATHQPVVDPFQGFVPGRANEVWRVRRQAAGWRVEPAPVRVEPVLPAEGSAPVVVREWVDALSRCDAAGAQALQVDPHLYGPLDFQQAPCKDHGAWTVGTTLPFDEAGDQQTLVSAFGDGVGNWARVVPVVGGKVNFLAAVAPVGDVWRVVGVSPDAAGGGGG